MAEKTAIHWCDSTVNPIMGCNGCELFPKPKEVLKAIDDALLGAEVSRTDARAEPIIRKLAETYHAEIPEPSKHHRKTVTTTNIWHLRQDFVTMIRGRHGTAAAKAAEGAVERSITCYAAKLHLNRACGIVPKPDGTQRDKKKGYAPTFEEITRFKGRMQPAADLSDLYGKKDLDRPWIDDLPRLIFISDMGDALSRTSDFGFLKKEVMEPVGSKNGLRHLWIWLTKRPEIMADFASQIGGFPDNVCAMTTVTGPDTLPRIDELRKVRAKVRGLSIEPLWARLPPNKLNLKGIDWVILGGESGSKEWARPFAIEWAEELRDHCAKNGVAFFLKQLGRNPTRNGAPIGLTDDHGGDWAEWPDEALRVRKFPDYFYDYRRGQRVSAKGKAALRRADSGGYTPSQQEDFKRLDKIVGNAARSYVDAGVALHKIKEHKLFKIRHASFKAYCDSVHQISQQYAYRLIKAGRIQGELSPIGENLGSFLPTKEAHFRELARLPDRESRVQVLEAAVEVVKENGGVLTAKAIRTVVDNRIKDSKSATTATPKRTPKERLGLAREKLQELEELLERGEDPKKVLAALRKLLVA